MTSDSDSDNEEFLMSPGSVPGVIIDDSPTVIPYKYKPIHHFQIEFIRKDYEGIQNFTVSQIDENIKQMALNIIHGQYIDVILSDTTLNYTQLCSICSSSNNVPEDIRKVVSTFIHSKENIEWATMECMLYAYTCFELYCQMNYTGPELTMKELDKLGCGEHSSISHSNVLMNLECDGNYPFKGCELVHMLLIARSILQFLADPTRAPWQQGITLDCSGAVITPRISDTLDISVARACRALCIRTWLSARVCLVHLRLLQKQIYTENPTLFHECENMFNTAEADLDGVFSSLPPTEKPQWRKGETAPVPVEALKAQLLLERGISYHFFDYKDKGKNYFNLAREQVRLSVKLTAALGKRTKYQQQDHAQLLLVCRSSLAGEIPAPPSIPSTATNVEEIEKSAEDGPETDSHSAEGWEHGKFEMGRRVVTEGDGGEEVAIRSVRLDDVDGGAAENILLEQGIAFSQDLKKGGENGDVLESTLLHPIDQAIVLALCLDVGNSNPADGLTTEEMHPYVRLVLNQYHTHQAHLEEIEKAKNKASWIHIHKPGASASDVPIPEYDGDVVEPHLSWMTYSTALLERSYLEFEKRRTMERAVLQIQALLDQHTTRLTAFQPDQSMIKAAAPAHERIKYLPCLIYPAQYEIKRDLAQRYLRCQVFNSALNLFKELEMWDEVVTCFQLLQKPHRAELLVRERLAAGEETPYMICALADLTQNEELYEKSWVISKGRYGRAKRTLARICFDSGRYEECCAHLDAALKVHPLVPTAWYLKGIACMRLENWAEAILAFTRCVQQDIEIGEAWANIGAVHMRLTNWARALEALLEAQKHKPREWRIIENLMMTTLEMGRLRECVVHMNALLDLRMTSNRPVHMYELRKLICVVALHTTQHVRANMREAPVPTPCSEQDLSQQLPPLSQDVEKLLVRIINTLKSDPDMWDTVARYHSIISTGGEGISSDPSESDINPPSSPVSNFDAELRRRSRAAERDVRVKHLRCMIQYPSWEKDDKKIKEIIRVAKISRECFQTDEASKADIYALKSLLGSAMGTLITYYQQSSYTGDKSAIGDIGEIVDSLNQQYDQM